MKTPFAAFSVTKLSIAEAKATHGSSAHSFANFQGTLDNVCVYNRALTLEELQTNAFSDECSGTSPEEKPVLHLKFDNDRVIQPSVFDEISGKFVGYTGAWNEEGLHFGWGDGGKLSLALARDSVTKNGNSFSARCLLNPAGDCLLNPFLFIIQSSSLSLKQIYRR